MFQLNPLAGAIQRVLSGTTLLVIASTHAGIVAAKEGAIEEIVVTGSRIPIDANLITSSPVTMIEAAEFHYRGITRVEDFLNDLPSISSGQNANTVNGTGVATIELRGMSANRALVLTNGHRMGFGDAWDLAADINSVPEAMIERVEILTGGASSTYGSDAMAGVVNFIMKQDFDGIQVDYQYSAYQHDQGNNDVQAAVVDAGFQQAPDSTWDGAGHDVNVTMGVNSPDGKGNITTYLGYRRINAVTQSERDFSACDLVETAGPAVCTGSITIPTGLFTPFDGSYYYTVAGDQFVPWNYNYYNYNSLTHFQRPDERYTAGLFGHYEVSKHLGWYVEFQFMDVNTNWQNAPSGDFFSTNTLNCDNPLLSAQQAAAIGCSISDIAAGITVPVYIGRRNVEGGPRNYDIGNRSYRILGGIRGAINDEWSYDAYANFSTTASRELYLNDLSLTRITRALDVVDPGGVPTCRSVIDGSDPDCVPWNIFRAGGVTQAAENYLQLSAHADTRLEQDQYVAFLSGDLTHYRFRSPYSEDGVKVVIGGEYRDEKINYNPDENEQNGDIAGLDIENPDVTGNKNVSEVFFEARIPLAQDRDWIKSLTLDIGYRYSVYNEGKTTNTYKATGEWTPVRGIKFRGGYSRAVRAADLRELFEPRSQGTWYDDPCAGPAPMQTLGQCRNSGVTAAQYGNIPLSFTGRNNAIWGGNPDLEPEKANTFTVGAVITPEDYIPGLTVSVDYWSIEIKNAIHWIEPDFIVTRCGLTGNPVYCSRVHRGSNGNLWLGDSHVDAGYVNIGFFKDSGIDIVGSYSREIGEYGAAEFTFRGTWAETFDLQVTPDVMIEDCVGFWGGACGGVRPVWQYNVSAVWTTPWHLTLAASWRHIDGVDEQEKDRFSPGAENYLDVAVDYSDKWFSPGEITLSMGVNNVMDNDPPVSGFFGPSNTDPGMWEPLGRYFFFGISQKF